MYVLTCPLLCFSLFLIKSITRAAVESLMPLPRFEFYPGFTIQTLLGCDWFYLVNFLNYGSSGPFTL